MCSRCAGTPQIGSSRRVAKPHLSRDDHGTMNSEIDHTRYWGIWTLPFDNAPDQRFYVRCSQHDAAHRWLSYGIQTGKGMLLLTGDAGCGKNIAESSADGRVLACSVRCRIYADRPAGIASWCCGNSAIEPVDVGPCASGLLTAEEPTSYITVHMAAATEWTGLFIKEAMAVMYEQGRRIVRLLNAHCDQRLSAGAIEHDLQLDERLVQRVGTVI